MFEKLGVIADIHGNALALEAVLQHAERCDVRRFVNLGDILYGPFQPLRTYRILQRTNVVASITGNQDRQIFDAAADDLGTNQTLAFVTESLGSDPIAWLRSLPATAVIDGTVFLCHGTPTSDTTYFLEDVSSGRPVARAERAIVELLGSVRERVVLCGHTHIPRMVQLSGGQLIVNPGSVGVPAYDDYAPVKHLMETHSPHASYAVLEESSSGWDVSFHRVAYPWDEAAKQALHLNRDDWARGIATGKMA
jgi:diadenosine tetraphosphatase ApaH/serine/threonine PP2A family protein phosphatase